MHDSLAASAHDGQDEQVWAPSDMSDAAVGLSASVPTSPSVSPAPPDQSSASVVVLQDDSLTVVAVAELTDARPGIALSQQVDSLTASALPMSAAVSSVGEDQIDLAPEKTCLSKNARKQRNRRIKSAIANLKGGGDGAW